MKVLKKFNNSFSANLAKGILASEGIDSYILNENISYVTGTANNDLLSIELVVEDELYDKAKEILGSKPVGQ